MTLLQFGSLLLAAIGGVALIVLVVLSAAGVVSVGLSRRRARKNP